MINRTPPASPQRSSPTLTSPKPRRLYKAPLKEAKTPIAEPIEANVPVFGKEGALSPRAGKRLPTPLLREGATAAAGEGRRAVFSLALDVLWKGAQLVVIVTCLSFVAMDVYNRGFSSSNGRFVSFMDSFNNCYNFRAQHAYQPIRRKDRRDSFEEKKLRRYHIGSNLNSTYWRLRIMVLSFFLKYGSSTVVSLLLRTTPTWIKGPRHVLSFLGALSLVQLFPRDGIYWYVSTSPWMQLVLGLSVSFYKLRKLLFVVGTFSGRGIYRSWLPMLALSVIAIDGNSLARRIENVISHRGIRYKS